MADWDLLLTDARVATMTDGHYGIVAAPASIAIRDRRIAWLGPSAAVPDGTAVSERSLGGRWVTPALIDCHTHLVFAGNRAGEFEQRLAGASYADIAEQGGGILTTVRATREASCDELVELALPRARALCREGVATIEIKSGYGLTVDDEIKMLRAARRIGEQLPVTVQTTLLAAHTVPPEFAGRRTAYVDLICEELLPAVAEQGLADAVDAYCEGIAFDVDDVSRIFALSRRLGLPVKLHADQLSDSGGAAVAARFGALSADHLEYSPAAGIAALADAGGVGVLLPGAFLTLGETRLPPVDAMRAAGLPIAVASDCNPGTSPICSLRMSMLLAARLFRLTPEECLAGVTCHAARALGLADRGTLAAGQRADIAVWDIDHPRDLAYWGGTPQLAELL